MSFICFLILQKNVLIFVCATTKMSQYLKLWNKIKFYVWNIFKLQIISDYLMFFSSFNIPNVLCFCSQILVKYV